MKRLALLPALGLVLTFSAIAKEQNHSGFNSIVPQPDLLQPTVLESVLKHTPGIVHQPRRPLERVLKAVGNAKIRSTLFVNGTEIAISGRASLYFKATNKDVHAGIVKVGAFNLAYFNVPQQPLTKQKIRGAESGVLGFVVDPELGAQYLEYDPDTGAVSGQLRGYVDAAYMAELVAAQADGKRDLFETPKQEAVVRVRMQLEKPLRPAAAKRAVARERGALSLQLEAFQQIHSVASPFSIATIHSPLVIDTTQVVYVEITKHLCIQPVRIASINRSPFSIQLTGDGLAFGMPGANEQWAKAGVVFSVNEWITLWAPEYRVLSGSEAASLRSEVNVDDCVEVFFVRALSPQSMWGGGATWGSGSPGTKIISSDGNAANGIDLTHLAHELGHAMGLPHPDGTPGVSTGTLMCPSGWMADNPRRNSQENKDNISNPLFTFALTFGSSPPDCQDSADCGACFTITP
jgi:hypothetical protein